MHPSLQLYKDAALDIINGDFEIEHWDDACQFTEGPVWSKEGYYLFSDIPANCIYEIDEDRKKSVFLANSGTDNPQDPDLKPDQIGSNALAFDKKGRLLICQHGSHGIALYDGKLQPYINSYYNKPLNSPNDFILHDDGRLFFSDPPYGLKDGKLNPIKFQPVAGVYCYEENKLELVNTDYQYPNGVCLSPGQQTLYICSNKPFEKRISTYDTVSRKMTGVFAEENSDGIECDRKGNVYLCNKDGLIILDKKGERLALISLPTIPANICWGGKEMNDLFVTARQNIFLLRNLQI
jgi:gluconolactonase